MSTKHASSHFVAYAPGVPVRSLTTGVPEDTYLAYRASLPDGMPVNQHLRLLIEGWLAGNRDFVAGEAPYADPTPPNAPDVVVEGPLPVPVDNAPLFDVDACLHPRGGLTRKGHATVCTRCGRTMSVI